MSQLQDRIAQFRKMAGDDPDNELGHFRLGQLYQEAEDYENAVTSFRRTLELSPQFSKVFQLLGTCLTKLGRTDEAIAILTDGWKTADGRGDRMPRDAMAEQLKALGAPIPEAEKPAEDEYDGPDSGYRCKRPTCTLGKRAHKLAKPPIKGELGLRIWEEVCEDCWNEWLKVQSIKVVNELRIDLSSAYGQEEYDKYMRGFFGFEEA